MYPDNMYAVLIVEDERIVAKDLQASLAEMGYDAFAIASSADEALSRVSERCPDVVLMDIRIKGERDGIETAALLRKRFDVPVVYLTAHADDATLDRAKKTEPYGYVMKPVKTAELRNVIEVAIYKHRMDRLLRTRERRLSTTLRSLADAVISVDLEGKVNFMNPAAEALTGVSVQDALGRPAREIVQLNDPSQPASPLDHVLEHKKVVATAEVPLKLPTNVTRIISDTASPIVDDLDAMVGAVMVFRDVTEDKLVQHRRELADRLASLGTMATLIARAAADPLAVVIANASYVLEELRHQQSLGSSERLAAAITAQSQLEAAAGRLARTIADLQTFARPAPPLPGEADVGAAIERAIRATANLLQPRARLIADVTSLVARVKIDESRLDEVLINLLVNAADAITPGNADASSVSIAAREHGGHVVIEIRDTGRGMSPEVLKRVFEPFSTTAEGVRSGLGLAICHGIVGSVGGSLEVESQPDRGSMFRVRLPVVTRRARVVAAPLPRKPGARILAIDDESRVLESMQVTLRGHDVITTVDARDAVAMLDRGERFDVIFSDMMMPHMNGMAFYEHVLVSHPESARRIVFLTGGALNPRQTAFLAAIQNVVLYKPCPLATMRATIEQVLAIK